MRHCGFEAAPLQATGPSRSGFGEKPAGALHGWFFTEGCVCVCACVGGVGGKVGSLSLNNGLGELVGL